MAVQLVSASSENYYRSASLSGDVHSFSCWVYITSTANTQTIIGAYDEATNNNFYRVRFHDSVAFQFTTRDTSFKTVSATNTPVANTWYHLACYQNGLSDRGIWVDGGNFGNNTTTTTSVSAAIDNIAIGVLRALTIEEYLDGGVFMPAVWEGYALTAGDAAALAGGVPPWKIRPESLIFYTPLGSADGTPRDWMTGTALTVGGTPATTEGPQVQLDSGIIVPFNVAAAAATPSYLTLLGVG